jgi:predicted Fe-Mo cluster-binding NifX family protein
MMRVALPIFHKRISPVLDSCERLLIIDLDEEEEIDRKEIFLNKMALSDRLKLLRQLEVSTVICGGISETLFKMLESCHIETIIGIAGDVDEVVCAFCCSELNDPKYCMPGYANSNKRDSE